MMKLTFTLAVALYAGFVIWGRPTDTVATAAADAPRPVVVASARFDKPTILAAADAPGGAVTAPVTRTVVPEPAVIAASAPDPTDTRTQTVPLGQPVRISLIETAAMSKPASPEPAAPVRDAVADALADALEPDAPEADGPRMVVTGSRVNVRAGPSTANAVVSSLSRGTEVVSLGRSGGWIELRDPASGLSGYMSANFLDPA